VLNALYLDTRWGAECTETLELLELYGPDGERYEDERIAGMIEDTSTPMGRPVKRLLRLLKQIDKDWERNEKSGKDGKDCGSGNVEARPGLHDRSRSDERGQ
jgi:hypothetical protein